MKHDIGFVIILHCMDSLCLSELGEIHTDIAAKLYEFYGQAVTQWAMDLLADTALPQISVYADAHYVTMINNELASAVGANFSLGFTLST